MTVLERRQISTKNQVRPATRESEVVPSTVWAGIATSQEDKKQRLNLVAQRYLEEGYITPDDLDENGLYVDKYEGKSTPLVAKIGDKIVASFRMIPNTPEVGLPINNVSEILVYPEWVESVSTIPFELSQLAKPKELDKDPRPTIAVIKAYIGIALNTEVTQSVAVIDKRVIRLLNGPFMGFGLPQIGPFVDYMGSQSAPVFIDVHNVIESSRQNGREDLANFLEGTKMVPGFEWYEGP